MHLHLLYALCTASLIDAAYCHLGTGDNDSILQTFFSNHVPLLNSKKYFMQLPVEFLIKSCCNARCSFLNSFSTLTINHCTTVL